MRKAYQKKKASKEEAEGLQLRLDREELLTMLQENLHGFGVELGRIVAAKMLEEEVRRLCGGRHERGSDRRAVRHGAQGGWMVTAGQKVPIVKPRVRARHGSEQRLETYDLMQREEAMPQAVLQRMIRGVSTRDYVGAVDLAREGFGVRRASVSRSIESSLSTARRVSRNVTRWRDGDMRLRWCAVGLSRAQQKFRRIKGYKHMKSLIAALDRQAASGDSLRRTA